MKNGMLRIIVIAVSLASTAIVSAARAAETDMDKSQPKSVQKAGAYIDDSVITAKVKAALVEDKQVSAMKIKVVTKGGVVTLRGAVPSAEAGQHALQLAAGVEGVKDVRSELVVKAG